MMEMQALDHYLRGFYQQPQNPQSQGKMVELQGRMRQLQQQAAQMAAQQAWGPGGPGMMGPGGPPGPHGPPHRGGPGLRLQLQLRTRMQKTLTKTSLMAKKRSQENPKSQKLPRSQKHLKSPRRRVLKGSTTGRRSLCRGLWPRTTSTRWSSPSTTPPTSLENGDSQASTDLAEQAKAEEAEEEAANAKPQLRVKSKTPQRAKPSKTTLLQFAKKKRKRSNSEGSDIDMDATPPPSPTEEECGIEKRRSGRNTGTKRKKYVDDVQMTFTEEELKRMKDDSGAASAAMLEDILGPIKPTDAEAAENSLPADGDLVSSTQAGPNYAFIDPTAEDTMIVQYILTARTGTRELEESEDEAEKPKVEVKEEETKVSTANTPVKEDTKSIEETEESPPEIKDLKDIKTDENEPKPKVDSPAKNGGSPPKNGDTLTLQKTPVKEGKTPAKDGKPARMIEVEEYLVKFKNFSYLHCQWLTEQELTRGDKRINGKIKRFHQKRDKSSNVLDFCDEEPFNPDYVEVDRVLDASEHTDEQTKVTTKHYLVKWRSLPYEDCTWELEADVDPKKIEDFMRWRDPPAEETFNVERGKAKEWKEWNKTPVYKNGNSLRPYQLEGVNWLNYSWYQHRNCLLADEMGLGKTIQSLAWIHHIWEFGIRGPFLVIAPLSTIPNWQREFELWTDMNVIVYHGSQTSRNMIQEYEMYYKTPEGDRIEDVYKFHVLITTYECIINDILDLKDISWRACVIDEAHRLKNQNCKLP